MRIATLTLVTSGIVALASLPTVQAHAATVPTPPALAPQVSEPAIQPVWYDRWGRWHPPYPYGYRPPPYYGYGPPRYYGYGYGPYPYGYWHHRRWECYRWGRC